MGAVNVLTGRYKHTHTLGAGSQEAVQGVGRRESKHVVPEMLLKEILMAIVERVALNAERIH